MERGGENAISHNVGLSVCLVCPSFPMSLSFLVTFFMLFLSLFSVVSYIVITCLSVHYLLLFFLSRLYYVLFIFYNFFSLDFLTLQIESLFFVFQFFFKLCLISLSCKMYVSNTFLFLFLSLSLCFTFWFDPLQWFYYICGMHFISWKEEQYYS